MSRVDARSFPLLCLPTASTEVIGYETISLDFEYVTTPPASDLGRSVIVALD